MPIAGTNIPLNTAEGEDKITTTDKVTSTYLSNGATELLAANIVSESLADDNEKYYFGIAHSDTPTTPEFHVAYGNTNGCGGDTAGGTIKSPTEVIYKQFASLLLPPTEVTGGFFISSPGSSGAVASGKDEEIYILSARRSLMKDRLNKKNWTLFLTGSSSATAVGVGNTLYLTDDSVNDSPTATPVGDRYNIVSGSDGTVHTAATTRNYGFFYPDLGILVFSGQELSASIPGNAADAADVVIFDDNTHKGFGVDTTGSKDNNYNYALRFINCLQPTGAKLKFRNEEDQVSAQYFCRIKSGHMNFSNNPTFVSGSLNELRQTTMKGNPTSYITQVQLYNGGGDMVAVGNLSTPLKKNFSSEATVKVKLTY